jgi:hypothetical protein
MDKKRLLIILAAAGIIGLLVCIFAATLIGRYLNERETRPTVEVTTITACDADPSVLCVVSFGVDNLNRMVINFQLPSEDYGSFYVKARHGETVSVYPCQVLESAPTSAFCTGERTPLGEPIEVKVYSTDGDLLIAQGTLIISAVALPTAVQMTDTPTPGPETPTVEVTSTATGQVEPPSTPRATPTKTPGAYSN